MKTKTKARVIAALAAATLTALTLTGCNEADTASRNLSQDADNFKIHRDITVTNGITGKIAYAISGLCSLGNDDAGNKHTLTCKIGKDAFVKEIIWIGDQDEVLSVQTKPSDASPFAYRVYINPTGVDLHLQTAGNK